MKTKIGTVLEEKVARQLREFSAKSGRSMSDIIQEAVTAYIQMGHAGNKQHRLAAVRHFRSRIKMVF